MCVRLTCVHSETSGHVFVFVWVRVCTPVLLCTLPAVCRRLSLSVCIWAFVSVCVAVGPGLPTGLSLGWCVCLGVSVSVERCVSLSCTCLRRAARMPWAACLRL